MRRTILIAPLVALICAAGFAVALLSFPAVASAWSPTSLPPGWTIEHDTGGLDPNCQDAYRIWTDTHVFSDLLCTASPTYQQDFDAWVDAHYTPPATTTAAPATTAATTTDTVPVTTTVAAATTTAAPPTTTDATAPAPAVTTTASAPVTTTATCDVACLNARVAVLEQNYAALASRVDAIAKANDASWAAFVDALNAGASTVDAAIAARSAGLNAIYQLG